MRIEYTTIEEVNEARQRHVEAVLDVFDVYLNTDNILVFANATVDCILCLLKYVRGPGEFLFYRPTDKQIFVVYNCSYFHIHQFKHFFWVLKRIISLRWFF